MFDLLGPRGFLRVATTLLLLCLSLHSDLVSVPAAKVSRQPIAVAALSLVSKHALHVSQIISCSTEHQVPALAERLVLRRHFREAAVTVGVEGSHRAVAICSDMSPPIIYTLID